MSTHEVPCAICGGPASCGEEEHVLGLGGVCYEDRPNIEFCSVACFLALRDRLDERLAVVQAHPEEWPRVSEQLGEAAVIRLPLEQTLLGGGG